MNRPRKAKGIAAQSYRHSLLSAMRIFLAATLFSSWKVPASVRWRPRLLVFAVVRRALRGLTTRSRHRTVTAALGHALLDGYQRRGSKTARP